MRQFFRLLPEESAVSGQLDASTSVRATPRRRSINASALLSAEFHAMAFSAPDALRHATIPAGFLLATIVRSLGEVPPTY